MQAQSIPPTWPTAFYLQGVPLFSLGMNIDAHQSLKEGTTRKHAHILSFFLVTSANISCIIIFNKIQSSN